ncbi:hypothetical protein [Pseudarthrobacter sp. PH31-O2]|uniref:hypothetical protein n=1 Tax=Pseudarthrobacter sp. PH31-O2 TaxID=3046206 RepID=UPI0024B9D292|nr:hypothetical protein [Pseudarthrobacter sp. PH31-O2]MDJ0354419.1 hypothetical protein [Pseudarthrobacter sp. PH31-O2]
MSLIYDRPGLAAVTLTRIAAEESRGPGPLGGRIREVVLEFVERNGVEGLTQLTIALARQHFAALDPLARTTGGTPVNELLDAVEMAALEDPAEEY